MHSARCRGVQLVTRITQKPHDRTSVLMDAASAIHDVSQRIGVAIRYVLPVMWTTSCFHTMGPVGQNRAHRFEEVRQVAVPVGRQTTTVFFGGNAGEMCYLRLPCYSIL